MDGTVKFRVALVVSERKHLTFVRNEGRDQLGCEFHRQIGHQRPEAGQSQPPATAAVPRGTDEPVAPAHAGSPVSSAADPRTGLPNPALRPIHRPRPVGGGSGQKSRLPTRPVDLALGDEPVDRSRPSDGQNGRRWVHLSGDCRRRQVAVHPHIVGPIGIIVSMFGFFSIIAIYSI